MQQKITAIYKLTRVNTIMDFYPILMVLGFVAARIPFDINIVLAMISNLFILIFAFMINDVADADDDAQDPEKAKRNPVSAGALSKLEAYFATFTVAGLSVILILPFDRSITFLALLMLLIGYLYSASPVRLKSRPIVDILSHGFFLAFSQIIFFTLLPGATFDREAFILAIGAYLFSIGGDLYNETRDWEVDQKAGLKNTANLLGYDISRKLVYLFWGTGLLLVISMSLFITIPLLTKSLGSL